MCSRYLILACNCKCWWSSSKEQGEWYFVETPSWIFCSSHINKISVAPSMNLFSSKVQPLITQMSMWLWASVTLCSHLAPLVAEMLRAGLMRTLSPPLCKILPSCSNNAILAFSNEQTHRCRSTKASQKKKSPNEDPLLVSIKGLSEEEENYVRNQTKLCFAAGQPATVQGRQEELHKLYKKAGVKVGFLNLDHETIEEFS